MRFPPKEKLKEVGALYLADPQQISGFEEFVEYLESILSGHCEVWEEDGQLELIEIRRQVARIGPLRVEVRSNEHPPPHFHVIADGIDASFRIDDCSLLSGTIDRRYAKKVLFWHKHAKNCLIEAWNDSRPSSCVVGSYQ